MNCETPARTCAASQLIDRLREMVDQHGDLPVYLRDPDTDYLLPIGLLHKREDAVEEWPARLEIRSTYGGRPDGDFPQKQEAS